MNQSNGGGNGRTAAVIGAGAAGLCAAKHLIAKGIDATIFEIGTKIGGLWVYENDNGLSPAYKSLHINSEIRVTAYEDFPFPSDYPLYPNHWQVARYLAAYAERFDLVRRIRFNARVVQVHDVSSGGFMVELADGSVHRFDSVVVASGHQGVPNHPTFAKDFSGQYLHAHSYRIPEPFRSRHVLVVGIGNSACDIAADICTVTASTTIAARSPVLLMPRMLFGVPTSRVLARIEKRWVPWPIRRKVRELIAWTVHGTMEQWGFRTPKSRTHAAGHPSLMSHFIWGRVKAKPGVVGTSGRVVTFADGTSDEFDAIIAATGYHVDLPFLSSEQSPVNGRWLDLYLRVVRPGHNGLYFIGFFNVASGGNIRMMDDQAKWIAAIETNEVALPTQAEMERAILAERRLVAERYPDSPRYGLELEPRDYRAGLSRELKVGRRRANNPPKIIVQ